MPDYKSYGGITRKELNHLRQDLAQEGITIPPGDDVEVQGPYGIQLRATYNEAKETLKISSSGIVLSWMGDGVS